MIAVLFEHAYIFWLSLGGLLLAAEMLGGNGFAVERRGGSGHRPAGLAGSVRLGITGGDLRGTHAYRRLAVVAVAIQTGT